MGISQVKIEIGKSYCLRCGFFTGNISKSNDGTNYIFEANLLNDKKEKTGYRLSWKKNGRYLTNSVNHRWDIVK